MLLNEIMTSKKPINRKENQGPVSRKCRKNFGPEKLFVNLKRAYSVKLFFFSYVVKEIKIKITAKSPASRRLRLEDFGTFGKRAPDALHASSFLPNLFNASTILVKRLQKDIP